MTTLIRSNDPLLQPFTLRHLTLKNRTVTSHLSAFSTWKCGGRWSFELNHRVSPGRLMLSTLPTETF